MSFTNGEVGQAFQFDGATGYVSIPASSSLNVGNGGGYTIEGWVKPTDLSIPGPLLEWNNGAGGLGAHFWINVPTAIGGSGPGSIFANIVDVNGVGHVMSSAANLISAGVFNHVAMTYDRASGTAALYLNGVNVASQNLGNFTPNTTYGVILGTRATTSYYYHGLMDEMSLYNTALSSGQIQAIYNAGSGGKCAVAPVIVSEPQNQAVPQGGTISFSVNVTGSQPLDYQWFVNASNLPAATNATLTLTNVQLSQSGNNYLVMIANLAGSTNSSSALLTVTGSCTPPPSGLVDWWAGEGNALDSFGTNNGILVNGLVLPPARLARRSVSTA